MWICKVHWIIDGEKKKQTKPNSQQLLKIIKKKISIVPVKNDKVIMYETLKFS